MLFCNRLDVDTGVMVKVNHKGLRLAAETYYRTLDADGGVALVEYQPFTSMISYKLFANSWYLSGHVTCFDCVRLSIERIACSFYW